MVLANGTPVYEVQASGAVRFRGVSFSDEDLDAALSNRVVALCGTTRVGHQLKNS